MKKITFILPTKDRYEKLVNFINYHEKIFKDLDYKILILDGSIHETHKKIKNKFKKKKNLILIKQKRKGFMNACFEAIKIVKTKYCTFLYDDDLLSKEITKVFKKTMNKKFSLGYGIVENLNQIISNKKNFNKIQFYKFKNDRILLGYFGENNFGLPFMPVSPICFLFETNFLKEWKKYILKFCDKSKFRKYFLLQRNIGPDLIMYLLQILKNKYIYLAKPAIAKFNEHNTSMSYILGVNKLQIGYWLAKKSIFENDLINNKELSIKVYNFLVTAGVFILIKNFLLKILGKENYFFDINNEIKILNNNKNAKFSLSTCLNIVLNKIFIKIKSI